MRHRSGSAMLSGVALAANLLLQAHTPASAQHMQMQLMPPGVANIIRDLLPAVVNITSFVTETSDTATANVGSAPSDQSPGHAKTVKGSGFIIDPSGVIVTNNHVVSGAYDIVVMFSDGVRMPGRVLATAPVTDIALVKVDAQLPLPVVRWADSDTVQIADSVFAIGNPLGIGLSVSSGIVSALNRNLMDTPYDDFIQTDAAINHGNSGGPLFNVRGEVIGIDTAIISPTTGSVGLGFAIPANDARFITDRLLHDGHIRPAFVGIKIEEVTQDMAAALGMAKPAGSIIAVVRENSPAAAAQLQVGDVILRYGDQTPADERALLRDFAKSSIGQPVSLTLLRDGREQTVQVTPVAWPAADAPSHAGSGPSRKQVTVTPPNLGLSLEMLTAELRSRYQLNLQQTGVLIGGVTAETDAFERGLTPGDVILRIQNAAVNSPQDVAAAIDAARAQQKAFILALVLPKVSQQVPGPRWIALKVTDGMGAGARIPAR